MPALALDLRSYPGEMRAHAHPYHQVILALDGAMDLEIGTAAGRVRSGRVDSAVGAIVPAGTRHGFVGIGRNRFITLDIARESTATSRTLLAAGSPFFAIPRTVGHLLGTVEAEGEHRLLRSRLAPVLAEALVAPAPDEALPRAVLRALAFLERGFPRPITTRDVAGAAGISVPRLHALFAQWLGQGPGQYLAALRLDHARDRLIRSSEPVAEIALAAGYSEQSAFTRAFRRRFGETPAAFRRRRVQ